MTDYDPKVEIGKIIRRLVRETHELWRQEYKKIYAQLLAERGRGKIVSFEDGLSYFIVKKEEELLANLNYVPPVYEPLEPHREDDDTQGDLF